MRLSVRMIPLIVSLFLLSAFHGQRAAAEAAHQEVFLWRIEGKNPSFLFGTIHVPDDRATTLPAVVQEAFDHADAVHGELAAKDFQDTSILERFKLPEGKNLKEVVGEEMHTRFEALTAKKFVPAGSFDGMHPTAAIMNYIQLDMLPAILKGKQVLDMKLGMDALAAGKENAGLETLDEQISLLIDPDLEEAAKGFKSAVELYERLLVERRNILEELLVAYLSGDASTFEKIFEEYNAGDPESAEKFMKKLIDDRNVTMADRITVLLKDNPGKSYFFAIGAGHFLEDGMGIHTLLAQKGPKVTRVSIKDASALPSLEADAAN